MKTIKMAKLYGFSTEKCNYNSEKHEWDVMSKVGLIGDIKEVLADTYTLEPIFMSRVLGILDNDKIYVKVSEIVSQYNIKRHIYQDIDNSFWVKLHENN